jgi:hypothetical protein
MKDRFHDNEFEQFLKRNADQYRMFPSEKVWTGIHNSLHSRRKWFGFGVALLVLSTGIVSLVMLMSPTVNQQLSENVQQKSGIITVKETLTENNPPVHLLFSKNKKGQEIYTSLLSDNFLNKNNLFTKEKKNNESDFSLNNPSSYVTKTLLPVSAIKTEVINSINSIQVFPTSSLQKVNKNLPQLSTAYENNITAINKTTRPIHNNSVSSVNHYLHLENEIVASPTETNENYNFLKNKKRLTFHFYLVPTISYRKLKENKAFLETAQTINGGVNYTWIADLNSIVTHKPDIGFELGFGTIYPITKNLRFTSGLQFNVSKYDIKAFSYPVEIATIALRSNGGANSVSAVTNYRNYGGINKSKWLHNLYISASVPVGAEWVLSKTSKSYIGVGGNIQPTYILANRAYLISTDYKNYAEVPSLNRRWNVNTSFEVFAGSSTGKLNWRIGPQVRYQTLSSFQDKYPVKEHLFDFGLKLGIILK